MKVWTLSVSLSFGPVYLYVSIFVMSICLWNLIFPISYPKFNTEWMNHLFSMYRSKPSVFVNLTDRSLSFSDFLHGITASRSPLSRKFSQLFRSEASSLLVHLVIELPLMAPERCFKWLCLFTFIWDEQHSGSAIFNRNKFCFRVFVLSNRFIQRPCIDCTRAL